MNRNIWIAFFVFFLTLVLVVTVFFYGCTSERFVCLWFDDGSLDQVRALPVLDLYDFKATFSVSVNKIGSEGYFSWEDLERLRNEGHEIVCHGFNHVKLLGANQSVLKQEIVTSKQVLADHGFETEVYVIPYGYYNQSILELINEHYSFCRITAGGLNNVVESGFVQYANEVNRVPFVSFQRMLEPVNSSHMISVLYHHVDVDGLRISVSLSDFKEQMQFLHETGFVVKPFSKVVS